MCEMGNQGTMRSIGILFLEYVMRRDREIDEMRYARRFCGISGMACLDHRSLNSRYNEKQFVRNIRPAGGNYYFFYAIRIRRNGNICFFSTRGMLIGESSSLPGEVPDLPKTDEGRRRARPYLY